MRCIRKQQPPMPETQARRGVALVEFAIIISLLVVIAFGCVDFGRFVYVYAAVTNAAQEGATYGSMNPSGDPPTAAWVTAVKAAAVAEPSALNPKITASHVITVTNTTSADPSVAGYVTVRVEYPFSMLVLAGSFGNYGPPKTVTLGRTVVMPRTR